MRLWHYVQIWLFKLIIYFPLVKNGTKVTWAHTKLYNNTHIHSILSLFLYHIHVLFLHTRGKGRDLVIGDYFCLENFSEWPCQRLPKGTPCNIQVFLWSGSSMNGVLYLASERKIGERVNYTARHHIEDWTITFGIVFRSWQRSCSFWCWCVFWQGLIVGFVWLPIVPFFAVRRIPIHFFLVLSPLEVVLLPLFFPLLRSQFVPPLFTLFLVFPTDLSKPLCFIDSHLLLPHSVKVKVGELQVQRYKSTKYVSSIPGSFSLHLSVLCTFSNVSLELFSPSLLVFPSFSPLFIWGDFCGTSSVAGYWRRSQTMKIRCDTSI